MSQLISLDDVFLSIQIEKSYTRAELANAIKPAPASAIDLLAGIGKLKIDDTTTPQTYKRKQ